MLCQKMCIRDRDIVTHSQVGGSVETIYIGELMGDVGDAGYYKEQIVKITTLADVYRVTAGIKRDLC